MEPWRPTLVTDKHKLFCRECDRRHHVYACGSADDGESVSMGVWRCGAQCNRGAQGSVSRVGETQDSGGGVGSIRESALVLLRGEERKFATK